MALHTLNLCSGYDGLGLALDIATGGNARAVCHVEIEIPAAAILADAMGKGLLPEAPIWSDLRTFDALPWRGVVDIVVAGYPCQPFSVAGKRGGESDPRHLWPEVARIVEECQPAFGFFENVSGHLVLGFDRVAEDLERLGYRVAAGVFTASEVGASHQRERLFILAHRESKRLEGRSYGRPGLEPCGVGLLSAGSGQPMGYPCECGQCGESRRGAGPEPENGHFGGVEHSAGARRETTRRGEHDDERGEPRPRCPLFPPGPSDQRWGRIIERWPDLAPAVESSLCRVADGRPARVDQLRMLGNGVVPLQGAYAFCALASVLGFWEKEMSLFAGAEE